MFGEQPVELAQNVVERLGAGQVEYELVAGQHGLVAVVGQRPLGMGPVEVAVGVDHPRLDPDAEGHSQPGDVSDQGIEAFGVGVG